MREKDKEDVTAHEYLIAPPGQRKEWKKHKKKTRESTAICTGRGYTHKKQNTHALVEKQREMFLLLALPFT